MLRKFTLYNLCTKFQDNKADLIINYYVDEVLEKVMNILGIEIPDYNETHNLTKLAESTVVDWTISRKDILVMEKMFKAKCKGVKKKRLLTKNKRDIENMETLKSDGKSKLIKLEIKKENDISINEKV